MPWGDDKDAKRAYDRSYYHTKVDKQNRRAQVDARRKETKRKLVALKRQRSCERCPENHPACLEFHHRDPSTKEFAIADGLSRGYSWERILKEIEKCETLCRNCHAKEHWYDEDEDTSNNNGV